MNQKITIAINREYGSGGRTIGEMLAGDLGVHYYDKEILKIASVVSGINEALFNNADEMNRKTPIFRPVRNTGHDELIPPDSNDFTSDQNLFNYQAKVIRELCERESCVIVGRCAGSILREHPNVVRVFIHAPKPFLLEQAAKKKSLPPKELEKFVDKTNRRRAEYTEFYTGEKWIDAHNYDLCLDSSKLGFEKCVQIIKGYMKVRFDGLTF